MIGILGGTSFLETDAARSGVRERIVTPWGGVEVMIGASFAMIARHGAEGYTPPHRINHHAHLAAMSALGVSGVVSFASVGSLRPTCPLGAMVLANDIFAPFRTVTYRNHHLQFHLPVFDPAWRGEVLEKLTKAGLAPRDGGVYAETLGPRIESVAEVRALAAHADVVGMTAASEFILASELGLPHAILAVVDNMAHGIGVEPLSGDAFWKQVQANQEASLCALNVLVGIK